MHLYALVQYDSSPQLEWWRTVEEHHANSVLRVPLSGLGDAKFLTVSWNDFGSRLKHEARGQRRGFTKTCLSPAKDIYIYIYVDAHIYVYM